MVTEERWDHAQEYERTYWEGQAEAIAQGAAAQLDWYRWRAAQLAARLGVLGLTRLTRGDAKVVEIGSGPVGMAGFFPAAERVAVDPLARRYADLPVLTSLRSPGVDYRVGRGEALPCPDAAFDLALIENCIDHVQDIDAVMGEVTRVLKPGGVLYLTVNCRTAWGFLVHRVLSGLMVDRGHPHTFTAVRARRLVARMGYELLWFETGSPDEARCEDLHARDVRKRLKGALGVSEFVASAVTQRTVAA